MKQVIWMAAFVLCCIAALGLSQQRAQAASCSMNQSTLADLIASYDPPKSSAATAMTVPANTLTFTCSGLGTGSAAHVYVLLNGSTSATYTTPFLTGPNSFKLSYTPCLPGSGTCNGTTSVWGNTLATAYKTTSGVNGVNTINTTFSIFMGQQDAFVGTAAQYSGSLYFSFVCGEGGSQAAC